MSEIKGRTNLRTWSGAVVVTAMIGGLACGGSGTSTAGDTTQAAAPRAQRPAAHDGSTKERAAHACFAEGHRTDYQMVGDYVCPDGSRPLQGDAVRGAQARLGNVGEGPDGHVVDHYQIPCLAPVDFFVDAYHCPEGVEVGWDPENVRPAQMQNLAGGARHASTAPFGERETGIREFFVAWLEQTQQVQFDVCEAVPESLMSEGYVHQRLVIMQFIASLGGATIQLRETVPSGSLEREAHLLAVGDVLRLYANIRSERPQDPPSPALDRLVELDRQGSLVAAVDGRLRQCQGGAMMMQNGNQENVWPPKGPDCERFVACCERNGFVVDGAAVPDTPGLMCLMSATLGNCAHGIEVVRAQGATCP